MDLSSSKFPAKDMDSSNWWNCTICTMYGAEFAWANGEANRENPPDAARWAHFDWQPKIVDLHISGSWAEVPILDNNPSSQVSYTKLPPQPVVLFLPINLHSRRRRPYFSLGAGGRIEIASFRG